SPLLDVGRSSGGRERPLGARSATPDPSTTGRRRRRGFVASCPHAPVRTSGDPRVVPPFVTSASPDRAWHERCCTGGDAPARTRRHAGRRRCALRGGRDRLVASRPLPGDWHPAVRLAGGILHG